MTKFQNLQEIINTIQHEDCIKGMRNLPKNSIDLIIADPPYNLSKGNKWSWDNEVDLEGFGGKWDKTMEKWDKMGLNDYMRFTYNWLSEAKRVLCSKGSIWTFGTYHNIGIINVMYQLVGIEIINEIIWYKRNAFPNLSGRRFTASHETLLWGHAGGKHNREYTFHYERLKEMELPEDKLNKPGKQVRTVWDIPNNKSKEEIRYGKHPTQKPLRVLERIILASSSEGELCLVPFCGSGSACLSAKLNRRNFIGFEIEEKFIELAKKRLDNTIEKPLSVKKCSNRVESRLFEDG